MFQFPSNGKVHGKGPTAPLIRQSLYYVSIPFKREGTWKVGTRTALVRTVDRFQFPSNGKVHQKANPTNSLTLTTKISFNSLQTGRYIKRFSNRYSNTAPYESFNSLQTGRYIKSIPRRVCILRGTLVSIPFKREGTSKDRGKHWRTSPPHQVSIPFKREGTSKEGRNCTCRVSLILVSIPFKREGTSKARRDESIQTP